jgi:hypothetical protein
MAETAGIDLGKKVGPLPLGAWVAVVGAGLALSYYMSIKQPPADTTEDATGALTGDDAVGVGGGQFIYEPPQTATTAGPVITNNDEWAVAAIRYLISKGYDAASADAAIRLYMAAEQLTTAQWAMVTQALAYLGPPPVPLAAGPSAPTPPTTPSAPGKPVLSVGGIPSSYKRKGSGFTANLKVTRTGKPAPYAIVSVYFRSEHSAAQKAKGFRWYNTTAVGSTGTRSLRVNPPVDGTHTWRFALRGGNTIDKHVKWAG